MAYMDLTRKTLDYPLEMTVCLTKADCTLLRKRIKQDLFVAQKQYGRLRRILEAGTGTPDQTKSFMVTQERYESLISIMEAIDEILSL